MSETAASLPEFVSIRPDDQGYAIVSLNTMRHPSMGMVSIGLNASGLAASISVAPEAARRFAAAIIAQCDALEPPIEADVAQSEASFAVAAE
jgi:hypothetical protein